jgi:hypothetical protein
LATITVSQLSERKPQLSSCACEGSHPLTVKPVRSFISLTRSLRSG